MCDVRTRVNKGVAYGKCGYGMTARFAGCRLVGRARGGAMRDIVPTVPCKDLASTTLAGCECVVPSLRAGPIFDNVVLTVAPPKIESSTVLLATPMAARSYRSK